MAVTTDRPTAATAPAPDGAASQPARHRGLFTIPVTPFTDDGALDVDSLRRLVAFCVEAGAHGIVAPVNASEFTTLSAEERHLVTRAAVEETERAGARGRVPVVIGVGARTTPEAAQFARYAEQAGVLFSFEAHVLQIVERPEQQLWLMEQVNSPALKVNFDISHFDVLGIPTEESVQALVPDGKAVHTHLKDQRGRSPDHEFLIPGEGDFDYVRYLTAMQAAGYAGYIVPEISLMVQRRPDYDPLAACTQSYVALDRAFQAAGIARPVAVSGR